MLYGLFDNIPDADTSSTRRTRSKLNEICVESRRSFCKEWPATIVVADIFYEKKTGSGFDNFPTIFK